MMNNYLACGADIFLLQMLYNAAPTKCVKTLRYSRCIDQVSTAYTASNESIELSQL